MIFNLFESRATKTETFYPSEDGSGIQGWSGADSYSGVSVTSASSHTFLAFGSAVRLISGLVGRLPLKLQRRMPDGGRETLRDDPRYTLVHDQPNNETSSVVWRETIQGHGCTWGNGYSEIVWDGGEPVALKQLRPDKMDIRRDRRNPSAAKRLWYIYDESTWLTPQEVLHVPWFTGMGYKGLSPVELHREDVALGIAGRQFGASFYNNGGWPGVVWSRPVEAGHMSPEAEQNFLDLQAERLQGPFKSHRALLAQEGMTAQPFPIPIKDAQYLESRRFSVEDMARIFNLPPFVLGEDREGQSRASLEVKYRQILDFGVMPWLVRWEQELNRKLLTTAERARGLYFEFDVMGFLRGDTQTQAEVTRIYVTTGVMAHNEARQKLNLPAVPGGNEPMTQFNQATLSQIANMSQAERALLVAAETRGELPAGGVPDTAIESRAERSLAGRYRLRTAFLRVLADNAGRLVRSEVKALTQSAHKLAETGDVRAFLDWLETFYKEHGQRAIQIMGPPLFAYMEAIAREIAEELERPAEEFMGRVDGFSRDYREAFGARTASQRRVQVAKILDGFEGDNPARAILDAAELWADVGAERMAAREGTQALGAVSRMLYGAAGVQALVWHWPGGDCGICPKMNGRTVSLTARQPFLIEGDKVESDTTGALKVRSIINHPPLHRGCTCGVRPG